jgi:hypothetical protein
MASDLEGFSDGPLSSVRRPQVSARCLLLSRKRCIYEAECHRHTVGYRLDGWKR